MSRRGLGSCPLGSTPAGVGYAPPATPRRPSVLVCADGSRGDCARVDAVSGDFLLTAAGEKEGWTVTEQRVYLALRTVKGSAAVAALGIELPSGGVLTSDTIERIRRAVLAALAPLVAEGAIVVRDIITNQLGGSSVRTEVRWRDTGSSALRSSFT